MNANIEIFEIDVNDACFLYDIPEKDKNYYRELRREVLEKKGYFKIVCEYVLVSWEYTLPPKEIRKGIWIPEIPYYKNYKDDVVLDIYSPCYLISEDLLEDYFQHFLYWKINSLSWKDVHKFLDYWFSKEGYEFYHTLELCAGSMTCLISNSDHYGSINTWLGKNRTRKNKKDTPTIPPSKLIDCLESSKQSYFFETVVPSLIEHEQGFLKKHDDQSYSWFKSKGFINYLVAFCDTMKQKGIFKKNLDLKLDVAPIICKDWNIKINEEYKQFQSQKINEIIGNSIYRDAFNFLK